MTLTKKAAEVRTFAVSLSHKLIGAELLTGTPTVVEVTTAALTISGVGLNLVEQAIGGRAVIIGRAVVFTVAGGSAGTTYTLRITASSDATTAQTLIEEVELRVN